MLLHGVRVVGYVEYRELHLFTTLTTSVLLIIINTTALNRLIANFILGVKICQDNISVLF